MSLPVASRLAYQKRASTPLTDVNFRPARNGGRRRRVSALPRFGPMSLGANGKFNGAPAVESFEERTEELERRQNHSCDWIGSHAINQTAKRRDQCVSGSRLKIVVPPWASPSQRSFPSPESDTR